MEVESRNRGRTIHLTESEFRNIITEAVRIHLYMLTESQESKSLDHAKKLYMQRMNASRAKLTKNLTEDAMRSYFYCSYFFNGTRTVLDGC